MRGQFTESKLTARCHRLGDGLLLLLMCWIQSQPPTRLGCIFDDDLSLRKEFWSGRDGAAFLKKGVDDKAWSH